MERGYERVPAELIEDEHLSLPAKATYCILLRLAYKAGRKKDGDAVELQPLQQIAKQMRCSVSALRGYITELKATGWVVTTRAHRMRPALYAVLWDPGSRAEIHASSRAEIHATRARDRFVEVKDTGATHPSSQPPKLVKLEGRNVAFDAVMEVCGISNTSPRVREIAPALNGSAKTGIGIREQYWRECLWYAERGDGAAQRAVLLGTSQPDSGAWEGLLASAIRHRAGVYRSVMKGATLTPIALQKWWTDVLPMQVEKDRSVLTTRMRDRADALRKEGR